MACGNDGRAANRAFVGTPAVVLFLALGTADQAEDISCTGECSGRPLPLEFLRTQPFAADWPTYAQSMEDDHWLDLLEAVATHPESVVDNAAKRNYLLGQPRFRHSFTAKWIALRALPQTGRTFKTVLDNLLDDASRCRSRRWTH